MCFEWLYGSNHNSTTKVATLHHVTKSPTPTMFTSLSHSNFSIISCLPVVIRLIQENLLN